MNPPAAINPWELPPLRFWQPRMLWRYLLILPFKLLVVAPLVLATSFGYIRLLPFKLRIARRIHSLTFICWRLFLGIKLEVEDRRSDPTKMAKIAVFNHASYIDGFIVGSIIYKFRTIAASWAFNAPLYGPWLKASHSIPLYRDKPNRNIAAQIHDDASDYTMTLTPEGTMTNGKGIIKFRTGAFIGKTAVQPIVFQYQNPKFNNCWIKTTSPMWKHLIMTISQTRNPVRVCILPAYVPSEEEQADPKLFAENVRRTIAEASGLPLIDATYKDSPALRGQL